jgi:hypothetical protein
MKNLIALTLATTIIVPQYHDITPNDGLMDAGSYSNPYVVKQNGNTIGTVRPRFHDITPNDGLMDAGSFSNPYELELE